MGGYMEWLKELWNSITGIDVLKENINLLENKIIQKQHEISLLHLEQSEQKDKLTKVKKEKSDLKEQITDLQEIVKDLKHEDPEFIVPEDIVNTAVGPYKPSAHFFYWDRHRDRIASVTKRFTSGKFFRMWTDEMFHFFRDAIKDCNTFDEKVVKLRDVISDRVKYESDAAVRNNAIIKGENWHTPTTTFYSKVGDCDSTSILWTTACHICNLPADRVFMATGYYKQFNNWFGHAYGLAKFDNGKWYVIETTSKRVPILNKNNPQYKQSGTLDGLYNWNVVGRAKKETF